MKKGIIISLFWGMGMAAGMAQSVYPGICEGRFSVSVQVPLAAESFDLQDVRLLPGRFRDNMMRDSAWMVSIGADRLLHGFRTTAGVFAGREGGYMTVKKLGGWESLDCELRGHTTGHMLSALALMYAATGSDVFKMKGDSLVAGLAEVQAVGTGGYLKCLSRRTHQPEYPGKECLGTLVHVAQIVFRLDRPIPVCRECAGIGRGAENGRLGLWETSAVAGRDAPQDDS